MKNPTKSKTINSCTFDATVECQLLADRSMFVLQREAYKKINANTRQASNKRQYTIHRATEYTARWRRSQRLI